VADRLSNPESREERVDAVILQYLEEIDAGRRPDPEVIIAHHPDLADELRAFFADHAHAGALARPMQKLSAPTGKLTETLGDAAETAAADVVPTEIGGYRPLRLLGAGGMGRVYEAEDAAGRRVALKLISPGFAASQVAMERFRREGRLAGMISHPRCVFVLAADEEQGQPYIVMELMSGSTLKDLVDREGPLPPAEAVVKILDVLEGLEEAHQAGVLHRDVKPGNCYLDADGRVKIGDFGLSRSLGKRVQLTQVGAFVGTPLFASPEQLKGEELDARTDVYSVAATLYFLLTGQAPFQHADAATVIARVVSEPPPSPRQIRPEIPAALEQVVLRGLERQRERRFASLDELREALLPLLSSNLTIAGLGLRIGAYLLDAFPFWIFGEIVGVWNFQLHALPNMPAYLANCLCFFLYLWLAEGLWGQSLGKWLVGMRVTRANSPEPGGLGRVFVRTAVLFLLYGMWSDLLLWFALDRLDRFEWVTCHLGGEAVGLLVCFGMARARNGYRGLHELVSGTRTVRLSQRQAGRLIVTDSTDETSPEAGTRPQESPAQLGPFRITGVVRTGEEGRLLRGEDVGLGRQVWLCVRSAGTELPAARREVARSTRLRWLATGEKDGQRWDAFVAPAGQRLPDVIGRQGPVDWPAARGLLVQLAEELAVGVDDGTLPPTLSLDQLWIHRSGRLQLTDWAVGAGRRVADPSRSTDERALDCWRDAAALLLEGRPRAAASTSRIGGPVPLHARRILDRLTDEKAGYARISQLAADLAETRGQPPEVTLGLRALQMALASLFVVIGLANMFIWGRMAAYTEYIALDRTMLRSTGLALALEDESLRTALRAELPAGHVLQQNTDHIVSALHARVVADRLERDALLPDLGPIGKLTTDSIRQRLLNPDEPLRVEREPGEKLQLKVLPASGDFDTPDRIGVSDVDGILAHAEGGEDPERARFRLAFAYTAMGMVALFPGLWVVWGFLFRGGLSFRFAGLALVRSSGRPALRVQCAGRALVLWTPAVVVLLLVVWLDASQRGGWLLCTSLQGLAALVLALQAALTLRFPSHAPHDRLAGVFVVPR
jgi:eukaryotic-like serine/threonine-protein kinase